MAESGRYRDYDRGERGRGGWTEDLDRSRTHERARGGFGRGNERDDSMFGSNWRDRDESERERGGWGSLWSPSEERSDSGMRGRERERERSWRDDDSGSSRSRAWSHDEDRRPRSERHDESSRGRPWDDDRGAEREPHYGADDERRGLPINETNRLIASNKVEGTAVYGLDGARLGSIYNFMVDKYSGKVEYAVMTYGGFLGMGTRYYPLPWRLLKYDVRQGGYRVDLTERDLQRAPSFDRSNEPSFDTAYGERVHGWYGLSY